MPKRGVPDPQSRKYDWSFGIGIEGGEVVFGKSGEAPMAPVDGYAGNIVVKHDATELRWQESEDRVLYFRTNKGNYGQLKISVHADRSKSGLTGYCQVAYNPDGERVIE
jgi:hypothetical protein